MVREENEYLKRQCIKLRDRNMKVIENDREKGALKQTIKGLDEVNQHVEDKTKLDEDKMKTFKDKNSKLLSRLKEEVCSENYLTRNRNRAS